MSTKSTSNSPRFLGAQFLRFLSLPRSLLTTAMTGMTMISLSVPANADITILGQETDGNVVFSYSGSVILTGLTKTDQFEHEPGMHLITPWASHVVFLDAIGDVYENPLPEPGAMFSGIQDFGQGYPSRANSSTGDSFALGGNFVGVPVGYLSGDLIEGTMTFLGETFASLGIDPLRGYKAALTPYYGITLSFSGAPALAATHWLGQTDNTWSGNNWASDAAGTATAATPKVTDDITFAATGAANQLNTILDADFTIRSLEVHSATGISTPTLTAQRLTVNTVTVVNALLSIKSGVTLHNLGSVIVTNTGTLAGAGAVTAALNHNIFINGTLSAGDASLAPAAATLSLSTSGNGAVVMGAGSFIAVDLFTGAAVGDNTGLASSSDRLDLTGNLDAAAGGTLVIGNPNGMSGFAGGDQWLVADLNGGAGTITGTLALNDSALGLTPTQIGNFDQTTGVYKIIDTIGGFKMADAQSQMLTNGSQTATSDVGNHISSLMAGDGEEAANSSLSASLDEGVVIGQGDGPEDPIARKVLRSRQWEL
ncbi:MAG: hypothetical protein NTX35_22470, partial [Verrucomicrobia bacterium]|nr:hypothetical protein [Verrucomicrobiota bacterium]